jgi:hypothetical protein
MNFNSLELNVPSAIGSGLSRGGVALDLNKSVNRMGLDKYPNNARVQTIKNRETDQVFSVLPAEVNDSTYSVMVNDQCLWAYNDEYYIKPCAANIGRSLIHPQFFEVKNIITKANEQRYMGKQPTTSQRESYPYSAFIHKTTQQCLTYDTDGLYLAACDPDNNYQKWDVSPDKNFCLMDQ